jgi:hypothetical protein
MKQGEIMPAENLNLIKQMARLHLDSVQSTVNELKNRYDQTAVEIARLQSYVEAGNKVLIEESSVE